MAFCRTVEILYAALPLRPFRDWLIRAHMDRCPHCQVRLVSREEAKALMVGPDAVGDPGALWQRIVREAARTAAARAPRPPRGRLAWQWTAAAAGLVVVALAGFWLLRQARRPGFETQARLDPGRFEIAYVKVGGEPAQTFVYQPQGTDTVFVWAQPRTR